MSQQQVKTMKPFISVGDYFPDIHLLDSTNFALKFKQPEQFELFGA